MQGITDHGEKRVRKRLSLPKSAVAKVVDEAREHGRGQAEYSGRFRRYLDRMGIEYHTKPIVHKGNIFIFADEALVTMWPVPSQFRRYT